jgi:hypothetical protein
VQSIRPVLLAALVATLAGCVTMAPGSVRPATPQRPTLSSDTNTTALGTFEIEAGVALDPGETFDSPVTLKYGFDERSEVFVGLSPLRWADEPDDAWGIGDLAFGARRRVVDETDERPAVAVLGTLKLPTADADDGLGSGETDVLLAAIAQKTLATGSLVGFWQLGLLGAPGDSGIDIGNDLALAYSAPLDARLGVFAELAAQLVAEYDHESVYTNLGFTFMPAGPELVLDFGCAVGLSDDAADLVLFVGTTRNPGSPLR